MRASHIFIFGICIILIGCSQGKTSGVIIKNIDKDVTIFGVVKDGKLGPAVVSEQPPYHITMIDKSGSNLELIDAFLTKYYGSRVKVTGPLYFFDFTPSTNKKLVINTDPQDHHLFYIQDVKIELIEDNPNNPFEGKAK